MDWRKVDLKINQMASEAAINVMEELGSQGVIVNNDEKGRFEITAYYPDNKVFPGLLTKLKEKIYDLNKYGLDTGKIEIDVELTNDEDWSKSWHKFFKPTPVGKKFLICPSWEKCLDPDRYKVQIDPGMAFGVGTHETTQMCVILLEKYINNSTSKMLDIGTGTGILAIIAAKLGVKEITGVDIDPAAVAAAKENIRLNGVGDRIEIIKGDLSKDISGSYSLIVANLLPNLIKRLLPSIPDLLMDNGTLILSGIIKNKRKEIIDILKNYNFFLVEEICQKEWLSFVVRKG